MDPQPMPKKSMLLPLLLSTLVGLVVFGGGGYYFGKQSVLTPTPAPIVATPKPKTSASPTASASPSSATESKTYENNRIGYSFQYQENDPNIDVDETIKFDPSKTYTSADITDMVQFVHDNNTYRIETHSTTDSNIDTWMDYAIKNLGVGGELTSYSKTTVGGVTAYSKNDELATYVLKGKNVIAITASKQAGATAVPLTDKNDAIYKQLLTSFKFTK